MPTQCSFEQEFSRLPCLRVLAHPLKSNVVVVSSSQVVTRQQRKRAVDAVTFQVLDNPSLREEILSHVIFGKDSVDRKAACTLRLVEKSWNESVLWILRQVNEPLFRLDGSTGDDVERFVSTFASSAELMGSVPPLTVRDIGVLNHPENLESFSNCLTRCGDALIQLGFKTTENGRPFTAELQNWSLPCLHKLELYLILDFLDNRSDGPGQVAVEDDQNTDSLSTCLVKSVLSNATALSELKLVIAARYPASREITEFPVFYSVILPPSLTKITAIIIGSAQHLEILARSPLPNLTSLTMHVDSGLFSDSDSLIIRILDNCRKPLKKIILCGRNRVGQPGTHHVARFPVMEQLVTLFMDGVNVEPELGRDSLDKYFPKLATLHLPSQTTENFQKWTGSSPVPGVAGLRLLLRENSKASLTMETMQRVNFVFPNLHKLMMTMSSDDSSGLEYIFRELRQLTLLEINVECYLERSTSSDIWDSLITGVPVEVIARSRVEPDFWEKNEMDDENLASIKNLTELRKCTLKLDRIRGGDPYIDVDGQLREPPYPAISDFIFNCALLKMPKLMEFHLGPVSSYNVSKEMTTKWRNDGRSLTFVNRSTFAI